MKRILLLLLTATALNVYAGDGNKQQVTLYLDAAHGGKDAGGKSAKGDLEKDIVLQLAKRIEERSAAHNVKVILIRQEDEYVTLLDRAAKTKDASGKSVMVSLHADFSENKDDHGVTVIMDKNNQIDGTVRLARSMMHNLAPLGNLKMDKKGLVVLRESAIPAVMVSPGFISNEKDLENLKSAEYQYKVAEMILAAVTMN
jgi:N-acetylmuramoyl-L-alanine amidase